MYCKKCGTDNTDSSRFCKKCGAELTPAVTPVDFPYEEDELIDEELYNKKPGKIMKAVIIVMVLVVVAEGVALYWPRINERIKENKDISIGDSMHFGAYEQDGDTSNGKEAIEWVVLDIKDGKALVISKYALDCRRYTAPNTYKHWNWETCSLRYWLNGTFLNHAFSDEERAKIAQTAVSADSNSKYSIKSGNETNDMVFLLSISEMEKYFTSSSSRRCKATAYAMSQGIITTDKSNCLWWLRSHGYERTNSAYVDIDGLIHCNVSSDSDGYGVRPALWIDLDS